MNIFGFLEFRYTEGIRDYTMHRKYFINHFADLQVGFIPTTKNSECRQIVKLDFFLFIKVNSEITMTFNTSSMGT